MGRHKILDKVKSKPLSVSLYDEQHEMLKELSVSYKCSNSKVVQRLIKEAHAKLKEL